MKSLIANVLSMLLILSLQPVIAVGTTTRSRQLVAATDGFQQFGQNLNGVANPTGSQTGFGTTVSLSSLYLSSTNASRLAVGAPGHGYKTPYADPTSIQDNSGGIFLFEENATTWDLSWFLPGDLNENLGERLSLSADGTRFAVRRYNANPYVVQVYDLPTISSMTPPILPVQVGGDLVCQVNGETVTLSANGMRVAVSCEFDNANTGLVEVFEWTGGQWSSTGQILGSAPGDFFGFATAFSLTGDRIAISAPNYDDNGNTNSGVVRVFDYNGTGWEKVGNDILGLNGDDQFGFSLDLSGDGLSLVASSPGGDNGASSNVGIVEVFGLSNTTNQWTPIGEAIYGVDVDDRFGRSVAISDLGTRVAATSYTHDSSRGHVRVFDLGVNGSWVQHGIDLDGVNMQDRFGHGRFGLALSGEGSMVACGSTRFQQSGQVRAFDVIEDPANIDPASTGLTDVPTVSPTQAPTPLLGTFDWDITFERATVVFEDSSSSEEISLEYLIHHRTPDIQLFDGSCQIPIPTSVIATSWNTTYNSSTHDNLFVSLDIDHGTITGSPAYSQVDSETGLISLCVRVDLLLSENQTISAAFDHQKLFVTVDMTQNFLVKDIDLVRSDQTTYINASIAYNVTACQCDGFTHQCTDDTLTPASLAHICIETTSTDIAIDAILHVEFRQGPLTQTAIDAGKIDTLTEVQLLGKKAVISTQLVSAFYDDTVPGAVEAFGLCALKFVDEGIRHQLRRGRRVLAPMSTSYESGRILTASEDREEVADFDVWIGLGQLGTEYSSGGLMTSGRVWISIIAVAVGIVLLA